MIEFVTMADSATLVVLGASGDLTRRLLLPALVMAGIWQGFAFWPVAIICVAGGMLGVLFTIPLRRALVTLLSGFAYSLLLSLALNLTTLALVADMLRRRTER